jgi:hypothetical protein
MSGQDIVVVGTGDLSRAFDDLVSGARSRESLSSWAATLRLAEEDGRLRFDPPGAEDRLREAIDYLEGVDLKDSPSTYLHVTEDFRIFRDTIGL